MLLCIDILPQQRFTAEFDTVSQQRKNLKKDITSDGAQSTSSGLICVLTLSWAGKDFLPPEELQVLDTYAQIL
jgi:hypothetical protein